MIAGLPVVLALVAFTFAYAGPEESTPTESTKTDKTRAALDTWLARIPEAETGKVVSVDDESVLKIFQDERFYVVRFMRYPRAQLVPPPLRLETLIRVQPDGSVQPLVDLDELKNFLHAELPTVRNLTVAREVALATLRLAEEYYQDGFYAFDVPENSVSVIREPGQVVASATAVVTRGGRGQVTTKLSFGPSGRVDKIAINGKVRPDVRLR